MSVLQKKLWHVQEEIDMKHGLGKGLNALFDLNEEDKSITDVDIDIIFRDLSQPRKHFDKEELDSLCQSIIQNGVIQPILVRETTDGYTIVAGERRFRAAKQARLTHIPIIVKDLTDLQVLEISLVENIQREDLNPIEEANAFKRLSNEFGLTQEEIAKNIGRSRVSVTNKLRLLNLSEEIQKHIVENRLSEGHGRALLSIEDENKRKEVVEAIIKNELSVRETEKIALKKKKSSNQKEIVEFEEEFQKVENDLAKRLGTKVNISRNSKKGKIVIEYYSLEGLNRIIDIIKK